MASATIHAFAPREIRLKLPSLLAFATLTACSLAPARQDRWCERVDAREVPIALRYAPQDDAAARQVRRALRVAIPLAERWGALSAPLTVTIHPTHEALEVAARRPDHPWLRAWARPEGIELQSPRTWSRGEATDAELAQLLAHELTHCVMFQAVGGDARRARTIPVWFREGMATSNAGESFVGVGALPVTDGGLVVTAVVYRSDSLRVYATADQAFRLLLRGYGENRIRGVLANMRDGVEFDDAFRSAIGVSIEDFEAEFRASVHPATKRG